MADPYERALVAVDAVVFTIREDRLAVLLERREKPPFEGRPELLGGLLRRGEDVEAALRRKLRNLFGERAVYFAPCGAATAPRRDPRGRVVSLAYLALVPPDLAPRRGAYRAVDDLPPLAFDHRETVASAHRYLRENLSAALARQVLPPLFPLNRLQRVYEIVQGRAHDNRNFRKKMILEGTVVKTRRREEGCAHRPAALFRLSAAALLGEVRA
jgi:8-oxo-dGTP diphosphatase